MTDNDKQMLDLEAKSFASPSMKEETIRRVFDCSATVYHQRLGALLEDPEALVYAPGTVNRLRRMRETSRQRRANAYR